MIKILTAYIIKEFKRALGENLGTVKVRRDEKASA